MQHASQDLQKGLDLGLVSPEVLQNFFDLERYPLISELTQRFQVSFDMVTILICVQSCRGYIVFYRKGTHIACLQFYSWFMLKCYGEPVGDKEGDAE